MKLDECLLEEDHDQAQRWHISQPLSLSLIEFTFPWALVVPTKPWLDDRQTDPESPHRKHSFILIHSQIPCEQKWIYIFREV